MNGTRRCRGVSPPFRSPPRPAGAGAPPRGSAPSSRSEGGGYGGGFDRRNATPRKRMMAQGRKTHFMHDAKALFARYPGKVDEAHVRAFLEGLFARGARQSTADAQDFLDEKLKDETITLDQRNGLGRLVEQYSF